MAAGSNMVNNGAKKMACTQPDGHRKHRPTPKAALLCITVGTFFVSSMYLHMSTDFSPPSIISSLRVQMQYQQTSPKTKGGPAILFVEKYEQKPEDYDAIVENDTGRQNTEKEEITTTEQQAPIASRADIKKRIESMLANKDIQNKLASLLDFAIVGFPKCGTTFLYNYLNTTESHMLSRMLRNEHCELSRNAPYDLFLQLFPSPAKDSKVGLKCPREIESEFALDNFATYFHKTKFIVSMRHPIEWFESFYNYVAFNLWPEKLPNPEVLIGPCQDNGSPYICSLGKHSCPKKSRNLCTDRGNFHHALSRFGKTPMSTPREMDLLNHHNMSITPSETKIFLIEIGQLNDEVDSRKAQIFRDDLRDFLGLEEELPPMIREEKTRKGKPYEQNEFFINICDTEHVKLRQVLLQQGRDASTWIREFFIHSPDVVVSSREYFIELLRRWERDPCEEMSLSEKKNASTAY